MNPPPGHGLYSHGEFLPDPAYRRNDVFVVGRQPTVTYNPRPGQDAHRLIQDYVDESGRILFITGPTKSGKTVLVCHEIPYHVRINGGDLTSVDDFWVDVVDKLVVYTDESAERIKLEGTGTSFRADASLKAGGTGVGFKGDRSSEQAITMRHTQSRSRGHRQVAQAELIKHRIPLIVDDFHHIDPGTQLAIIRGVKDLVYKRVPIIFVAVPHRAADVVRAESDMDARVIQLQIPPWLPSELYAIATKGFSALNVTCARDTLQRMAQESFGSPHLMQHFCLQVCKDYGVDMTLPTGAGLIIGDVNDDEFFRYVAATGGPSETYRRLAQGPQHRANRLGRRLRDGSEVDIYIAVLRAIAHTGPKTLLEWTDIRSALRAVLADNPPRRSEYTRVLEKMSTIARDIIWDTENDRAKGDPVLEYDAASGQLHISDPFFAYHLRWAVAPSLRRGL